MLLNLTLCLSNLLIKLLYLVFLPELLADEALLHVLLLLLHLLVLSDVRVEVHLVVFELLLRVDQRFVAPFLAVFKLIYLLIHGVVCEFRQEHLLLLVDELRGILSPLLLGELHSRFCDQHGSIDNFALRGRVG